MKKISLLVILCVLLAGLCAKEMQGSSLFKAMKAPHQLNNSVSTRTPIELNFNGDPITIQASFFDYAIGAYDGYPIVLKPQNNSLYMAFHAKATATATRRMYAAIVEDGNMSLSQPIMQNNESGGYGTSAMDPVSGYPFTAWHFPGTGDAAYDLKMSYYYDVDFSTPQMILQNTDTDNEYIWPCIYISNSPVPDKRRLYVFASNGGTANSGLPGSNVKMGYADFDQNDLDSGNPLEFTYRTFSYLDGMFNAEPQNRAYISYAVSDQGQIAIAGYVGCDSAFADAVDPSIIYQPHNLVVIYNDNYGEGDFSTYTYNVSRDLPTPTDEGGVADPSLEGYSNFKVEVSSSYRRNLTFDRYGKLHIPCLASVTFDFNGEAKYWPATLYVKDITFTPDTEDIFVYDLWPQGDNPADGTLLCPWDFNDDGQPDSYVEGNWQFTETQYPVEYWDTENIFHYQYIRMTAPTSGGIMASLWVDSYKSYRFNDLGDEDYSEFASVPEIYVSISNNNGATWSEPAILNSIDNPELANSIPVSFYLCENIRELGDDNYALDILYYDDNSYGSNVNGAGANDGGNIKYMSLSFTATGNGDVVPAKPILLSQNYPNPFNPSTTISYNVPTTGQVNLAVYNVKGQLVQTLVNGVMEKGNHKITWNGQDNKNQTVSSGVYFYKINTGQYSEMKKMLLVK